MRPDHEVALLHRDVVHRRVRQVLPQRLPVGAIVKGDVDAVLGAQVQEFRHFDVLANRTREVFRRDAVHDLRPGLPVIVRAEDVWLEVVLLLRFAAERCGSGGDADPRFVRIAQFFGVTFFQLVPPSRVTCEAVVDRSDDVHVLQRQRDQKVVASVSTPVLSFVIGRPTRIVFGSWRVRSGLIFVQLCPSFVDFQRCCEPT